MSERQSLRATNLRQILTVVFALTILGIGGGFYLGLGVIREYAVEVAQTTKDAEASTTKIDELYLLQQDLARGQSLVDKANELFAAPATYQSQALTDLERYASRAGVSISETSFSSDSGAAQATVTLNQPVNYDNLLYFLTLIEGNLPKMQVDTLTVTRTDTAGEVTTGPIVITVTTRSS